MKGNADLQLASPQFIHHQALFILPCQSVLSNRTILRALCTYKKKKFNFSIKIVKNSKKKQVKLILTTYFNPI